MSHDSPSQSSLDSISIKLTQSHLPSANYIRTSQEMISLTYTVSIENMSDERLPPPEVKEHENMLFSIESKGGSFGLSSRYRRLTSKEEENQVAFDKEVFKKKSVLKISNMEFSGASSKEKNQDSPPQAKGKKTPIKLHNSGIMRKTKSPKNDSMIQSRIHSRSKETVMQDSIDNSGENVFMRTARFYSLKNDRVVEPKNAKKTSIKKEIERRSSQHSETDRKYNRLPIIKGSNFHSSAPSSMAQRRKVMTCHENAEINFSEKQVGNLNEKMILGKSCKMSENDEKAKKYLQKIIQNRNSIIHYSQKESTKFLREFKENIIEDFF